VLKKKKAGGHFHLLFSWYFLIPFYSEGKGAGHVCCADTHITHKLAGSLPSLKFCGGLLYSEGFSSPQLTDVARPSVRPSVRDVCPRFALRCWPTRFDCPPSPGDTFPGGIWSVKRRAAMILTAWSSRTPQCVKHLSAHTQHRRTIPATKFERRMWHVDFPVAVEKNPPTPTLRPFSSSISFPPVFSPTRLLPRTTAVFPSAQFSK
jgi:hypothetical protein